MVGILAAVGYGLLSLESSVRGRLTAIERLDARLTNAVNFHGCAAIVTNDRGLGGMGVLNKRATHRFAAMCYYAGDNDTWLSFGSAATMRVTLAASRRALVGMGVCESVARAQVIAWDTDVYPRKNEDDLRAACVLIHGHVVSP